VAARAEDLPFPDRSFDGAMAVLSDHHWDDPLAGLREMARVARRVVVFQWDTEQSDRFWLVRDYLPEFASLGAGRPTLAERAHALGAQVTPIPISWDCIDGFFHAIGARPRLTSRSACAAQAPCGRASARRPSAGPWSGLGRTWLRVPGTSATARYWISTSSIWGLGCW
jgi:SAM-dependent methyltransferase